MKFIENETTWNIFLEAINTVFSETNSTLPSNITNIDFEKACKKLACYSVLNDDDYGDKSMKELEELEKSGEITNSHILVRLARHFYLLGIVEEKDTKEIYESLEKTHQYLGNQYYYSVNKEIIEQLLVWGNKFKPICSHLINEFDERMAQSALFLKKQGFQLSVKMGTISYSDETDQELFETLERKIASSGGNAVYKSVMKKYAKNYCCDMDRYLIGRSLDQEKNVPFNILLQISAKHLNIKWNLQETEETTRRVNEVIAFAEAFLDIRDVQVASGIEYGTMNQEIFPLFLINEMIFDKICVPQQYSAKYILLSLEHLIKPWFNNYAKKEYSYRDYYKTAEYFLSNRSIGGYVNIDKLSKKTKISVTRLRKILKDISISANEVNRDFTSLNCKPNLFSKPIIAFPFERYIFLDRHFCGIGFLYTANQMIKANFSILDREQGNSIEQMIREEMIQKGYSFKYGNYFSKSAPNLGECDLVLHNSKLAFVEVKKKSISDELDVLDDVSVLENLAAGMVRAQKQCFIHERNLRSYGELVFEKSGEKIVFESSLLPAYKISVCFPEYTFLTSKMFSMNLLEILLCGEFKAVDSNLQIKLDKLNKLGNEIRQCVSTQYPYKPFRARDISFNSLFCSTQQILTAVWYCNNEEEFFKVLSRWIHFTDKSLDLYISLFMSKYSNNDVTDAMLRLVEKPGRNFMILG